MKRKLKTGLSLLLTVVLVVGMSVPVFAEKNPGQKVTKGEAKPANLILKHVDGEKYENLNETFTAYKLFELSTGNLTNNKDDVYDAYHYTVNDSYKDDIIAVLKDMKKTSENDLTNDKLMDIIEKFTGAETRDFADRLTQKLKGKNGDYTAKKIGEEIGFEGVDQGYYLILAKKEPNKEEVRTLSLLQTLGRQTVEINTKEDIPDLTKESRNPGEKDIPSARVNSVVYEIGDDVPFILTGTLPTTLDQYKTYTYEFHDTLPKGLDANVNSIKVYVLDGNEKKEVTDKFTHTYNTDNADAKKLVIKPDKENSNIIGLKYGDDDSKTITKDCKIVVEYTAKLNTDANIGKDGNVNKAHLVYSNDPYSDGTGEKGETPDKKTTVFTFQLVVNKVKEVKGKDSSEVKHEALNGAGFTLYKKNAKGKYDPIRTEIQGTNAQAGTSEEEKTTFTFKGLVEGEYKIVESTVPNGYNKAKDIYFKITPTFEGEGESEHLIGLVVDVDKTPENSAQNTDVVLLPKNDEKEIKEFSTVSTDVLNLTRGELPSTGGIGTTLFYLIGGIAVVTAGVLYVTKRKVNSEDVE